MLAHRVVLDAAGADYWEVVFARDDMCVAKVTLPDGHQYAVKAVNLLVDTGRDVQVMRALCVCRAGRSDACKPFTQPVACCCLACPCM